MEIDALVGAVAEMGRLVEVPTPTINVVLSLLKLGARIREENVQVVKIPLEHS